MRFSNGGFSYYLFHTSLIMLSCQSIINYLFKGTPLNSWKQILIIALFFVSIKFINKFNVRLLFLLYFLLFSVFVFSLSLGVSLFLVVKTILYYAGWVPFFLFGSSRNGWIVNDRTARLYSTIIVISACGLFLQLLTPYLNFLAVEQEAVLLRSQSGEAQRFGFVFLTSTAVMPTLLSFLYISKMGNLGTLRQGATIFSFLLSVIPTGSVSAALVGVGGGALDAMGRSLAEVTRRVLGYIAALVFALVCIGLVVFAANLNPMSSPKIQAQIERIESNDVDSTSNSYRKHLWQQAATLISNFAFYEHFSGKGLSTTSADEARLSVYQHGESSFFQAYIEGGIPALFLRLMPFLILFYIGFSRRNWSALIYSFFVFVACAVAPIFNVFGVSLTLGFIAGVELRRAMAR